MVILNRYTRSIYFYRRARILGFIGLVLSIASWWAYAITDDGALQMAAWWFLVLATVAFEESGYALYQFFLSRRRRLCQLPFGHGGRHTHVERTKMRGHDVTKWGDHDDAA